MFRMSLPSNSSLNYFPNNTAANFTVKIPYLPDSNAVYECALTEIMFPNRFKNVREKSNEIRVFDDSENVTVYKIEPYYYPTIVSLIKKIKDVLPSNVTITFDSVEERTRVRVSDGYSVHFGSDIARLLGFPSNKRIKSKNKVSPYHATPSGGLSTVYVYTDIIKPQIVGETTTPLLRIVNWNHSTKEENTALTFEQLYFSPLKNSHFDTINILLMDDTGREIAFEYGKVVVVLEFRKV